MRSETQSYQSHQPLPSVIMSETANGNNSKRSKNAKVALASGLGAIGLLALVLVAIQPSSLASIKNASLDMQSGSPIATASAQSYDTNTSQPIPVPSYYHGNYWGSPSTISTSGSSTTKVKPDKFSVTIGVDTNGTTAEIAVTKNADQMAKVIAAMKALGVKDEQMSTSNFNLSPIYSDYYSKSCPQQYNSPVYCPPNQVITGYRASNSVTVTLDTDGAIDAGKVIDASVSAGANNIFGVNFFISPAKQEQTRDNLTQTAIANAKHRAEVAAASLGMQVSGVQSVNLNDVYFPIYSKSYDMMAPMAAGGTSQTPIEPGQQDVSTNVSVVFYFAPVSQTGPSGMTSTRDNTNCTNPPNGPMIC